MSLRHPFYLDSLVNPIELRSIVQKIAQKLKEYSNVTHIAGRGVSGWAIISAVAYETGLIPIFVRQYTADHDTGMVVTQGDDADVILTSQYIIIDDLVASGSTIRRIHEEIVRLNMFKNSMPAAVLVYSQISRATIPYIQDKQARKTYLHVDIIGGKGTLNPPNEEDMV